MTDQLVLAAAEETWITLVLIVGTLGFVITSISVAYYHSKNKMREKTKQEIAAYVAEGSMTPQDAERILRAGSECE